MDLQKQKQFINAVKNNDINTVKKLINDPEIKPEGHYNHIAKTAAHYGFVEITKLLIKHQSFSDKCISSEFSTVIKKAYENKNINILQYLLKEDKITKYLSYQFLQESENNLKKLIAEKIKGF